MELGQAGLNLIKKCEGLRLKAYKAVPTEKYWTIGYGHYGADVGKTQVITEEQAENLLKQDVAEFVAAVNRLVKVPLNQNQFDALVSFTYNVGPNALEESTLLRYVNEKKFDLAAKEFDRWNKSGGEVYLGLVNRRNAEEELFKKEPELMTVKEQPTSFPKAQDFVRAMGVSDGYRPKDNMTREEFWEMLRRYHENHKRGDKS